MGKRFESRYNEVDEQDVIDDYVNGKKSSLEIGVDYECEATTIIRILRKHSIPIRKQGRQKTLVKTIPKVRLIDPNGNERLSIEKIREGIKRYEEKRYTSAAELGIFWKCSPSAAFKILKHHNVKRHTWSWKDYHERETALGAKACRKKFARAAVE